MVKHVIQSSGHPETGALGRREWSSGRFPGEFSKEGMGGIRFPLDFFQEALMGEIGPEIAIGAGPISMEEDFPSIGRDQDEILKPEIIAKRDRRDEENRAQKEEETSGNLLPKGAFGLKDPDQSQWEDEESIGLGNDGKSNEGSDSQPEPRGKVKLLFPSREKKKKNGQGVEEKNPSLGFQGQFDQGEVSIKDYENGGDEGDLFPQELLADEIGQPNGETADDDLEEGQAFPLGPINSVEKNIEVKIKGAQI